MAIDCIAGPSEIVVLADHSAHPDYVALDLNARSAEHSPGVAVLVTWHAPLMDEIVVALEKRLAKLSRADPRPRQFGTLRALVLARTRKPRSSVRTRSRRSTCTSRRRTPCDPRSYDKRPGVVFLVPFTPVAVGDYAAGPSHVLPTGGTARFASGLTTNDFRKRTSVLRFTRNG